MKVEGNNLRGEKQMIHPEDWIWVFESNFSLVLYRFLMDRYVPEESSFIHYESGSGLLPSLLIQSGFKVIGIEFDEKYRVYSELFNSFDFQVFDDDALIVDNKKLDLIVHPLFLFFDNYENFAKYLLSFLPKVVSFGSTIITQLLFSENIRNLRVKDLQSELLVLNNHNLYELFEFLLKMNIVMEINITGDYIDEEKNVEQLVVTFSPLP